MKCLLSVAMALALLAAAAGRVDPLRTSEPAAWRRLFNGKDLSGWETYLGKPPGQDKPLGLNCDPHHVFTVVQVDGEPAIRISGQIWGALTTLKDYGDYSLRLQFKWGTKKWPPEENNPPNSGLLYHCYGKHGEIAGMCMRSHEFQIKLGETGDYWGSDAIVDVVGEQSSNPKSRPHKYRPGGKRFKVHDPAGDVGGRVAHLANHELPSGRWNDLLLVCKGQEATHRVNGKAVMRVTGSRRLTGKTEVPLSRGKLQLLSEGAEIFIRRIEIREAVTKADS